MSSPKGTKEDLKDAIDLLMRVQHYDTTRKGPCPYCWEPKTHTLQCIFREIRDWLWYYHS